MASIGVDITQRLFTDAGITAGMRVLGLGCGQGDLSVRPFWRHRSCFLTFCNSVSLRKEKLNSILSISALLRS